MVTRRAIILCVICAFCALTLCFPCIADNTAVIEQNMLITVGNQTSSLGVSYGQGNLNSTSVSWDDENYTALFGARWSSYPDFIYKFHFQLGTGKDSVNNVFSLGHYMTQEEMKGLIGKGVDEFFMFLNREDNAFTTTFKLDNTSTGNNAIIATFEYIESRENNDFKTFCINANTTRYTVRPDGAYQFYVELKGVTVTYAGALDEVVIGRLDKTAEELDKISGKVDVIANDVTLAREDISNLQSFVETDGENTRTTIEATAKATQEAVDKASEQAHADADRAHEDSEKTQEAINNQPDNEYNKAEEKDKETQKDVDDLQNQVKINGVTDSFFGAVKNLWGFVSSTNVQQRLHIPEFAVTLPKYGRVVFWSGGDIDFGTWLNGDYWVVMLIKAVKVITGVLMLAWVVRFILDCVDYLLGNSNKTIGQIIFGSNPFKR